jgi:threonine synthase
MGNPVSWKKALKAIEGSGGMAIGVSDGEILGARRDLASQEGTFVENASVSPVAGFRKLLGKIEPGSVVVCILTGHGLKDKLPEGWAPRKLPLVRDVDGLVRELSA